MRTILSWQEIIGEQYLYHGTQQKALERILRDGGIIKAPSYWGTQEIQMFPYVPGVFPFPYIPRPYRPPFRPYPRPPYIPTLNSQPPVMKPAAPAT